MASHPRAIVIGGGLIGCMSAYYLAREGWRVRLLERDHIGSGASSGNCGYVCPSHVLPLAIPGAIGHTLRVMMKKDSPIAIRKWGDASLWGWFAAFSQRCRPEPMMQAAQGRHALLSSSMRLYRELVAAEGLDCDWQDQGLLVVYKSRRAFDGFSQIAELLRNEFGVVSAPYPGEEVTRLEATLRPGLAGGWHFPGDAHVRPDRLLAALRRAIENLGVEIEEGVPVRSLQIQGKRLTGIETSIGVEHADVVVVATGAEAPAFAKPLGCRIPIQPGKGYSITMRVPEPEASDPHDLRGAPRRGDAVQRRAADRLHDGVRRLRPEHPPRPHRPVEKVRRAAPGRGAPR